MLPRMFFQLGRGQQSETPRLRPMSLSAVAVLDLVTGEAGDRGAVAPHLPQVGRTVLSSLW